MAKENKRKMNNGYWRKDASDRMAAFAAIACVLKFPFAETICV